MTESAQPIKVRRADVFIGVAIVAAAAAVAIGAAGTAPNIPQWYDLLRKPWFTPPNAIFGPVWSVLYVLMAFAAWRIWRAPPSFERALAASFFLIQLFLNLAWSWLFFAAHSTLLGLIDIIPQWLAVIGTIVVLRRFDRLAAISLVPLAIWVGFAAILNLAIWRLN